MHSKRKHIRLKSVIEKTDLGCSNGCMKLLIAQERCIYLNKSKIIRDGRKFCRSWSELVLGSILHITEQREDLNLDCPKSQQEVELMLVKWGVWAAGRASDEKDSKKNHRNSQRNLHSEKKSEIKAHLAFPNVCTNIELKWSEFGRHIN